MIGYVTLLQQLFSERRENAALRAKINKNTSDIEYLSMMTDTELEQEEGQNGNDAVEEI